MIPQLEEGLQLPYIEAEVDDLIACVPLDLLPDVGAVGAGGYSIDLDHSALVLRAYFSTGRPSETQLR